jgi:hypothetical protein
MKKTYFILLALFAFIGVFSYHISTFFCWLILDDMQCTLQFACDAWDKFEYWIAHKSMSFTLYYVGYYGFVGTLCYIIEEAIFNKYKITNVFFNIFGVVTSVIVGIILAHIFGNMLGIGEWFEEAYNLVT